MRRDQDRHAVVVSYVLQVLPQVAASAWIEAGGFLSPLTTVPADWYTYPNVGLSEIVNNATSLGFDASDLMPAEVGAGSFWSGMIDWVAANGENTEEVFQQIEDSWPG